VDKVLSIFTVQRRVRQAGQGMVEYLVILSFGVMMLMGPGGDVLLDLAAVMKNKYRGYSYSLSMSALPEFSTGPEYREYIEGLGLTPEVDEDTLVRLTLDPVQENVTAALEPFNNAYLKFTDVRDLLGDFENLDDLAVQMATDAISPF
jgi:hypothetical protein